MTRLPITRVLTPALLAGAALVMSCGDGGPTGPAGAGTLTVSLVTPRSDDGALVLSLTGPGLTAEGVRGAQGSLVVHARPVGDAVKVLIVGDLASGPLLRLDVPDVSAVSRYHAIALEVADRANAVASVAGRTLSVGR